MRVRRVVVKYFSDGIIKFGRVLHYVELKYDFSGQVKGVKFVLIISPLVSVTYKLSI